MSNEHKIQLVDFILTQVRALRHSENHGLRIAAAEEELVLEERLKELSKKQDGK